MHSLAYSAIFGSLLAAAVGTLVLLTIGVRHGLWGRDRVGAELAAAEHARRQRRIRVADTFALLCFAVSAALAIVGVMQQARVTTAADTTSDRVAILARFEALETRVGLVEVQQQSGASAAVAIGDHIARLERRMGVTDVRATPVAPRVPKPRAGYTTVPAYAASERVKGASTSSSETPVRPLSTSSASEDRTAPAVIPVPSDGAAIPEAAISPSVHPGLSAAPSPPAASATASAIVAPPAVRSMPEAVTPPPLSAKADTRDEPPSIANQLRRDWEDLKRNAREGEWREIVKDLKQLFRP